jgi:hypothetical protein
LATRTARGLAGRVRGVHVSARLRDSVVGRNSFGHGPRAQPGLAEQVRLVQAWNTELGRGKKKDGKVEPHRRKPTGRLRARIDRG